MASPHLRYGTPGAAITHVPLATYGGVAVKPEISAADKGYVNELPRHLQQDLEIQQLCDLYQSQLAELNACHSLLTVDQERLASMLAPYVNANGDLIMEKPDPDVLLFKDGLDLRLKEFEEDCKRIQQTEKKLQDKIDEAASDYEQAVNGIAMTTDSRIYKRLREQQRQIELQQQDIDQVRFEKETLEMETKRLREMTRQAQPRIARQSDRSSRELNPLPRLHNSYEAKYPAQPLEGTRKQVIFHDGPRRQ
eukprot:TRINITY_DN3579_c0_g2_i1.p1 TRINITY_DN3579_c0_g2~~TRINITY_DN3579_c0_g2_i1.p1  ORF type:complete len:251 (+),score=51.53 TRINITY_DN3579_c0_g2_i1:26-778(+)